MDLETMRSEPIRSFDLMNRAGTRLAEAILRDFADYTHFTVFCGNGNNGGDGLVISRILIQNGKEVQIVVSPNPEQGSEEFKQALQWLENETNREFSEWSDFEIHENTVAIDALLGTGLKGEVKPELQDLIIRINAGYKHIVSIDINSGLNADQVIPGKGPIIHSEITYCVAAPKKSLLIEETGYVADCIKVIDIGWAETALAREETSEFWLHESEISGLLPVRKRFSHKGHCGHVVIAAGSRGKCGAGFLSGSAALRCGAGWVTLAASDFCAQTYQVNLPSAMTLFGLGEQVWTHPLPKLNPGSVLAAGPGLGTHPETGKALERTLAMNGNIPTVLDADALNLLAESEFSAWTEQMIITPHPGEFDRLTRKHNSHWERIQTQRNWSRKTGLTIVLKGGVSTVSMPDGAVYYIFNCVLRTGFACERSCFAGNMVTCRSRFAGRTEARSFEYLPGRCIGSVRNTYKEI